MSQLFSARSIAFAGGPLAALALAYSMHAAGAPTGQVWTGAVTVLCVIWWIFEPIPYAVTSLVPIAVFPFVGVLTPAQVAAAYGNEIVLLLMGGFILSTAMERSGAHRRIALGMIATVGGGSSKRIVFAFLIATVLVSMWISNTASALMLLPVALAVVEQSPDPKLGPALMLAIAYGASVGGMGTPIGSPPNLLFMQAYSAATGQKVSFFEWMTWGVPLVLIFTPVLGLYLTRNLHHRGEVVIPTAGPWRKHEVRVLIVFAFAALGWMTRSAPNGGWSGWFGIHGATDAGVALLAVIAMFLLPNGAGKGERLLDWDAAQSIPWGILLLFAGGITIASAFTESKLSDVLGHGLSALSALHPIILIAVLALGVTLISEAASNTATAALLMPIMAAAAVGAHMDPKLLMLPAVLGASCGFMLPIATGPNAAVFSTGRLSAGYMAREGAAVDVMGAIIITVVCYVLLR